MKTVKVNLAEEEKLVKEQMTKSLGRLWTDYKVVWTFEENLCGQTPKDPDLVKGWVDARKARVRPPGGKSIDEIQEEVLQSLSDPGQTNEEMVERTILGFQTNKEGYVMRGATVRSHLKECARIISKAYIGKVKGETSLGWRLTQQLYIGESWIPILRPDGIQATQADDFIDRAIHAVSMPSGQPINALKRIEYVSDVHMIFTMKIMGKLALSDIELVMQYGAVHGYAGERSMGEGRYTFTIERIDDEN